MTPRRTVIEDDEHVYEGWKEIAAAVGVSVSTVQRYARTRGLKVAFGPANRVWAEHGWLRAWKQANVVTFAAKHRIAV